VFKYSTNETTGRTELLVDESKCLHCKACAIKDPTQNIVWKPVSGGCPAYKGT
jgi:electron-transferring-flavoprotein dehydrogenase